MTLVDYPLFSVVVVIVLVIFWNNYNDARNNECKISLTVHVLKAFDSIHLSLILLAVI